MSLELLFWLVILGAMIIAEIATMGLFTIWFAGGALIAFIAAVCGGGPILQAVLFFVVSGVLLFTTRPLAKNKFNQRRQKTNSDSLVGEQAVVLEDIDEMAGEGKVQLRGQIWSAKTNLQEKVLKGDTVVVEAIEGVKLVVKKQEESKEE